MRQIHLQILMLMVLTCTYTTWVYAATTGEQWVAPAQEKALRRAQAVVPMVKEVKQEGAIRRSQRLHALGVSVRDVKDSYFVLNSPFIKAVEDHYGAVRFNHGQHAAESGDCTICHHLRAKTATPAENGDKPLETQRCSACHQQAFNPDYPERLGLKAAFHQRCIPCHEQRHKGPQTCRGCHLNNVPDHKKLVKLPDNADALQVTAECLRCHETAANDLQHSAHWLWRGPSTHTQDHENSVRHGKGTTALNNY